MPAAFQFPGQQVSDLAGWIIGRPGKHVGEPGLWTDAVEFGGLDQGVDGRRAAAALIGAGGGPVLGADSNRA
jgi:hypothetical protein